MNLVLGEDSMIGQHLVKVLDGSTTKGVKHAHYDLRNLETCRYVFSTNKPKFVYNLVGVNGGLIYNEKYPADIYYNSTQLNLNVLKCCHEFRVNKVISIISACSYPDSLEELREDCLFDGKPSVHTECHGFAKRTILEYSRQLNKQHGLKSISMILTNCYGDYDRFNLERTKVVGAVVRKIYEAKANGDESVSFRGDGSPIREMMYAGDAARCIYTIMGLYDDYQDPINVGSGQTISIRKLVETVAKLIDYKGSIVWDTSWSNGQSFRKLSLDKMKNYIQFTPTPLEDGLKKTIEYYDKTGRFLDR